jgi:transposase
MSPRRKRLAEFVSDSAIDKMIADANETGIPLLDGPDELIGHLTAGCSRRRWARRWTITSAT